MNHNDDPEVGRVTLAGGNVFEDLGFSPEEAAQLKIKSQLMIKLERWIRQQNLTQKEVAELLNVSRSRISDVTTGKIDKLTIDVLVLMLERAGRRVIVEVT